jgi:hypothetical protein
MELLLLARRMWRRRLTVGIGIFLAVAAAVGLGSKPSGSSVVATTQVTLDTHTSELAGVSPDGSPTLPWRASFLVHLMATDATQHRLAALMHVPDDSVAVIDAALNVPAVPSTQSLAATKASAPAAPYVLTVALGNESLPIIELVAAAPQSRSAVSLAQAAVDVLKSESEPGGRYHSLIVTAGGGLKNPKLQPFVVQQTAQIHTDTVVASSIPKKQIGVSLFVLFFWLFATSRVRRFRERRRRRARKAPRAQVA